MLSNSYRGSEMRGPNKQTSHSIKDHQELLWGLKFTVEGLLAAQTANVWSTYGGLVRLCGQLDKILRHRLRERQTLFAVDNDYWLFIQGLRRNHPVLAPSLDRLNRQAGHQGVGRGHLWLKTSLEEHTLSSQLKMLVDDRDHLRKCYYSDAFLCSVSHFSALYMCLQAVEQNNASVLADIDPMLLRKPRDFASTTIVLDDHLDPAPHPARPSNLPITKPDITRPPFASPKSYSILEMSGEHAVPHSPPPTGGDVQRDTARNILQSVLDTADGKATGSSPTDLSAVGNDPLLNTEFLISRDFSPASAPVTPPAGSKLTKQMPVEVAGFSGKESANASPDQSDTGVHLEKQGTCKCSKRSALFNLDMEDEQDVLKEKFDDFQKNVCRTCGKLRSQQRNVLSSSEDMSPCLSPDSASDKIKTKYRQRTLQQSKQSSTSATNLLEKRAKSVAVKRKASHKRSQSDVQLGSESSVARDSRDNFYKSSELSSSLPEENRSLARRGSFLENGLVSPVTECYFPQPAQGQSLMSFLSSQDFNNCPELDKENAHFCISEAIIAAVEQIKVKQGGLKSPSDHESDDDEIQELKQRIRMRRSENKRAKIFSAAFNDSSRTDFATTTSSSAYSSSQESPFVSDETDSSEDEVDEFDLSDPGGSNLLAAQSNGLTASLASLYSDADIQKANFNLSLETSSSSNPMSTAETVALSLLRKFSVKQLPAASDLEWMVSEQDAPQELLPLPKSLPISPDDGENADLYTLPDKQTRLRGNFEWAPPRAQIIFNIHPPPKRKVLVVKQNYRCAGCGMKIEHGFMKRLRYCEYLGKYFCHCCHNNASAYIPGRVLRKWDFYKYPVSNFAHELLNKMHEDPLFNVTDINPSLYRRVKHLNICKEYRLQLFYLKDFLKTCRLSQSLLITFQCHAQHLLNDPHVYSMVDILRVRDGELELELAQLVEDGIGHITQCQLCQAKGFVCELCNNEQDVIFPFQLLKTHQCPACWSCYHKLCWQAKEQHCPKCDRINTRKRLRNKTSPKRDRQTPVDDISPLVR